MYIGMCGKKICRTSVKAPNQSVCLTGLSGSGKTSRLNFIEYMHAKESGTVIVLDINESHSDERIFCGIREEYLQSVNRVSLLQDGLGNGLLRPMTSVDGREQFVFIVNAAVKALSSGQNMGVRQMGVLRRAVIEAMQMRGKFATDADAIEFALSCQDDEIVDIVFEKLWTVLHCGALKPASKIIQLGKINILGFSGADSLTQSCLAEIFLTILWQHVRASGNHTKKQNLVIVLDEFQNLCLKKDGILPILLREGRKYGISLLLATQTLAIFAPEVLALLNQTATQLYFRQTRREARRIAKEFEIEKTNEWATILTGLRVGEALATGNLSVNGKEICRPLLTV